MKRSGTQIKTEIEINAFAFGNFKKKKKKISRKTNDSHTQRKTVSALLCMHEFTDAHDWLVSV